MIFDPLSQYQAEAQELVVHTPADLKEILRLAGKHGGFRVLYQPRQGSVLENWRQVGLISYARGNLLLCIDEMGMLTENGQFLQDTRTRNVDPILKSIVHYGRHRKLDVICTAQRPTDVARRYTALCTEMRVFQTNEPKDLTYLCERIGQSATDQLSTLPKYFFLHWSDSGVAVYRPRL